MPKYHISWKEHKAKRESRITPYVKGPGSALMWLLRIKPYLLQYAETFRVKEWQRTDSR